MILEAALVRRYLNALWELAVPGSAFFDQACQMKVDVRHEVNLREYFGHIHESPDNLFERTLKRMVGEQAQ